MSEYLQCWKNGLTIQQGLIALVVIRTKALVASSVAPIAFAMQLLDRNFKDRAQAILVSQ